MGGFREQRVGFRVCFRYREGTGHAKEEGFIRTRQPRSRGRTPKTPSAAGGGGTKSGSAAGEEREEVVAADERRGSLLSAKAR
jgi:hypothetical protein